MNREDIEKPTLTKEMGTLEGCTISKGVNLLPSLEMLDKISKSDE